MAEAVRGETAGMRVATIWRYPVKAMLGERLDAAHVAEGGLAGDRLWVVVDAATGERIASKRGITDPRLRACRAQLGPGEGDGDDLLRITLPDGETVSGSAVEEALSDLLERHVLLKRAGGAGPGRLGRPAAHHDFAPVHLVTTTTIAHLARVAPEPVWDARRFRPNLVLDDSDAADGFSEDRLMDAMLRGPSGLRLAVRLPTPRCVVPTRASEELPSDPGLLHAVVQHHRVDLGPFGRQPCVGAYAEVAEEGPLAVGDRFAVQAAAAPPEAALADTVRRLAGELSVG